MVVNCLHFVSLLYWQQSHSTFLSPLHSCELLTFRIFALLTTVYLLFPHHQYRLWIAYISYLCFIDNSRGEILRKRVSVVNCLHFVSLLYWQQLYSNIRFRRFRCELLTFRIFALLTTVWKLNVTPLDSLWIAYISYLCFIDNSFF